MQTGDARPSRADAILLGVFGAARVQPPLPSMMQRPWSATPTGRRSVASATRSAAELEAINKPLNKKVNLSASNGHAAAG